MRCLSLWEPWASLLVAGLKRVETRGPHLAGLEPGPLLIHSAKRWMGDQLAACQGEPFAAALKTLGIDYHRKGLRLLRQKSERSSNNFAFGCVIGEVEVLCVMPTERVHTTHEHERFLSLDGKGERLIIGTWEAAFGGYGPGRVAIVTRKNAVRFPNPQPFKGHQGLFDVPDDVRAACLAPSALA